MKALKTMNIKGAKCKDCAGCQIHCVHHRYNVWRKPLNSDPVKTLKMDTGYETTSEDSDLPDDERMIIAVVRHSLRHLRLKDMTDDLDIGQKSRIGVTLLFCTLLERTGSFIKKQNIGDCLCRTYLRFLVRFDSEVNTSSPIQCTIPTPASVPCPALASS